MSLTLQTILDTYMNRWPVPTGGVIGIAVSGGADSLALALNLAEWGRKHHRLVQAVTVDHGLRPESADEAADVHRVMTANGIPHTTVAWTGPKPKTHLEERARSARYDLMIAWCKKQGIGHLFLAHHAGDQAETFWARLARGSGVNGLSAMAEQTLRDGVLLCRPFLGLDKTDLEADLTQRGIVWAVDSMNTNPAYERVRWRLRQRDLSAMNLTPAMIGRSTHRLMRARTALDFYTQRFVSAWADISPYGYLTIPETALSAVPEEVRLRALMRLVAHINPTGPDPAMETVETWLELWPRRATFGGCFVLRSQGLVFITREAKRLDPPTDIPALTPTYWNNFLILSSVPIRVVAGNSDVSDELPELVRRAIPSVQAQGPVSVYFWPEMQKALEKKFTLDYKRRKENMVYIQTQIKGFHTDEK